MTSGDWDGDGLDTIGMLDGGVVGLKNTNTAGPPDVEFAWGTTGWAPVAGVVTGD